MMTLISYMQLMEMPEFSTMCSTIELHHRNLKLGYLTGMPSDIRQVQLGQELYPAYIALTQSPP